VDGKATKAAHVKPSGTKVELANTEEEFSYLTMRFNNLLCFLFIIVYENN
jgi:hypothetical protein